MISIRFHGRGGQGAVIASKLLASAFFREGWQVQAFPSFGAERSGAPVAAFLRADRRPITVHYQVYEPDHVVVLDPVLLEAMNVTAGLRPGGWVVVNSPRSAGDLLQLLQSSRPSWLPPSGGPSLAEFHVGTVDATAIALQNGLGTRTTPIVNTAMAGAFAGFTGLVDLASLVDVMADVVPAGADRNRQAAREAYADAVEWRATAAR